MAHNNLAEVRHYSEIFMMKVIILYGKDDLLEDLCELLMEQLLKIYGQTNLNKNIAYMLLAGLILQMHYHHGLYTSMLGSVCSHIAYYRGLSQYFCYRLIDEARAKKL